MPSRCVYDVVRLRFIDLNAVKLTERRWIVDESNYCIHLYSREYINLSILSLVEFFLELYYRLSSFHASRTSAFSNYVFRQYFFSVDNDLK